MKESPRFLLNVNKHDEAVDVLQWIQTSNCRKTSSNLVIKSLEKEVSVNTTSAIENSKDSYDDSF